MPAFPNFDMLSDHGFLKRPTGSAIESLQTSTYWKTTGWRHASSPRAYMATGVTDASEPRYRVQFSLAIFDLVALSFGNVFMGLTTAAPPSADNTSLPGPYAGIEFVADTDNFPYVAAYALAHDGTNLLYGGSEPVNLDSVVPNLATVTVDFYITEADGKFVARIYNPLPAPGSVQQSRCSSSGDLKHVWSHFVVGCRTNQSGTSGSADTNTNWEIRVRELELGHTGQMPVNLYNEQGATGPMVMG